MTLDQINSFEKIHAQLESLHDEISALSKKSQNDTLNKFKLKLVNILIKETDKILGKEYIPFKDFKQFDEDDLPTNSDVTLILGQYLNCLEKLRSDNIVQSYGEDWVWQINGNTSKNITAPPKKIKK